MEQNKKNKILENDLKESANKMLCLEKDKNDLLDEINNLKMSMDIYLDELKKEVKK